jgi:SAM-dependent methyltransferase
MDRNDGPTDPGEHRALQAVFALLDRRPVLDLGFGTGRTVSLIEPWTDGYVGIDYTRAMVEAARAAHPGVDLRHGDARDLSMFDDATFALVVFSFNGIDAVDRDGRRKILDEAHRVLVPGGQLLYSTHNLDGPGARERPWRLTSGELRHPRHVIRRALALPGEIRNRRQRLSACREGDGWAVRVAGAHGYRIVIQYTAASEARLEVERAGFAPPTLFSSWEGRVLTPGSSSADTWWFHVLADKPI